MSPAPLPVVRGKFITVEGGEGAGKSTQIKRLAQDLARAGLDPVVTREPGGSPGAEEIRRLIVTGEPGRWDPMTEALLISAARRDHVRVTIEPALASGRWVLCDRFALSTIAYQGYGHGLDPDGLETLERFATNGLKPDLTLVFDIDPALGLARAGRRASDAETRFERMGTDFHKRLRRGFLARAAADPDRHRVIDASRDPDAVAAEVAGLVAARFDLVVP